MGGGGLTRWLAGRRFLYIEVPPHPLPPRLQIGPCKATLYHFEQKAARQQQSATCSRCLAQGHTASICESDIVCRECRKPGHERGDPACPLPATLPEIPDNATKESVPMDNASEANLPAPAPLSLDAEHSPDKRNKDITSSDVTTSTPSQQLIRPSRHSSQSTLAFHRRRPCPPGKRLRTSPVDDPKRGKAARKGERDNDDHVLPPQPPPESNGQSTDQNNTDPDIASQDTVI